MISRITPDVPDAIVHRRTSRKKPVSQDLFRRQRFAERTALVQIAHRVLQRLLGAGERKS
jgi:hypothetical protein